MRALEEKNVKAVKLVKHRMEKDNETHNQDRAIALKTAREIRQFKVNQLKKGMGTRGGLTTVQWAQHQREMIKLDDIIKTLKPKLFRSW